MSKRARHHPVEYLPQVLLTLVFDFCSVRELVLVVAGVCRSWRATPKNHQVWPRMTSSEFEATLCLMGPAKLRSLQIDLEFRPTQVAEALRQCAKLETLWLLNGTVGATRLLSALSSQLQYLHFEGSVRDTIQFHVPCICSSLRSLSLTRVKLGPCALMALQALEELTVVLCSMIDGALPLGLKSLMVSRNSGLLQGDLLRVCASLRSVDLRGVDLLLSPRFLYFLVSAAHGLRCLRAASSKLPESHEELGVVGSHLKDACASLERVELLVLDANTGEAKTEFTKTFPRV